jgi:hypothetical protein
LTDRENWRPQINQSGIEIFADILRLLLLRNNGRIQIAHNAHLNRHSRSNESDDFPLGSQMILCLVDSEIYYDSRLD